MEVEEAFVRRNRRSVDVMERRNGEPHQEVRDDKYGAHRLHAHPRV